MKVQTGDETLKHGAAANPAATCIQGRFIQRHPVYPVYPERSSTTTPFPLGGPFQVRPTGWPVIWGADGVILSAATCFHCLGGLTLSTFIDSPD